MCILVSLIGARRLSVSRAGSVARDTESPQQSTHTAHTPRGGRYILNMCVTCVRHVRRVSLESGVRVRPRDNGLGRLGITGLTLTLKP